MNQHQYIDRTTERTAEAEDSLCSEAKRIINKTLNGDCSLDYDMTYDFADDVDVFLIDLKTLKRKTPKRLITA